MTFESNTGLGTRNHYGPRSAREGIEGSIKTEGSLQELTLKFTGDNINDDVFSSNLSVLPAGARVHDVAFAVSEVFVLGGTTPTINIGTDGSEATNGISLAEAQGEAAGVYYGDQQNQETGVGINGTWAAELAADTQVSIALGGTTPTVTAAGYCTVTIRYFRIQQ